MNPSPGHVTLVGAGPGDPGLLTVAGSRALRAADVVLYDALSAPELLTLARADAELVDVGKRSGSHRASQKDIEELIVMYALGGKSVVRLKGGDPFLFGRGGEEALACRRAGVSISVIPGITSAFAVPAYAGIPVTHRGLSADVHVITSSEGEEGTGADWGAASNAGTLVILMGLGRLEHDMQQLMDLGKGPSTPAACISSGTRPQQRVVKGTIGTLAALVSEAGLQAPAITAVGPVAALAEDHPWPSPGRLAGSTVVVTRASHQASELTAKLESEGATVIEVPVIAIDFAAPARVLGAAVSGQYDWWVFTSANAVEATWRALEAAGLDSRRLAGARVAAISAGTANALKLHGITPDFVPARGMSEELGQQIPVQPGESVLLPRSSLADDLLPSTLQSRGAAVMEAEAYVTSPQPISEDVARIVARADAVLFTSASTATDLAAALGTLRLGDATKLVSMGPRTSTAIRSAFGREPTEAERQTLDALVDAACVALA